MTANVYGEFAGPGFDKIPTNPEQRLEVARMAIAAELISVELSGEPTTQGVQSRIDYLRGYEKKAEEDLAKQF